MGKKEKCCNQPKYLGTFRNWVDQNQIYENALKNLSNTSFDQTLDYLSSMYTCKMLYVFRDIIRDMILRVLGKRIKKTILWLSLYRTYFGVPPIDIGPVFATRADL